MENPAQKKPKILLTASGTPLGSQIALKLVDLGFEVYGAGTKQPKEELLESPLFTFLDLDLTQPIPSHIPTFGIIIHLIQEHSNSRDVNPTLSTITKKLISTRDDQETKLVLVTPITDAENISSQITNQEGITLIGLGHLFGHGMSLDSKYAEDQSEAFFQKNELSSLISQAIQTDKIILTNEGATTLYPTYIDDAVDGVIKAVLKDVPQKKLFLVTSSQAQSALSISYEIQNKARLILHKELGLYFAGEQSDTKPPVLPEIKIHNNLIDSKYSLAEALELTFEYFKKQEPTKEITNVHQSGAPIINPLKNAPSERQVPIKSQKIKNITKLPKLPSSLGKTKKIAIFAFALLLLFSLRTCLNIYIGVKNLNSAKNSLLAADFESANKETTNAQKNLSSAKKSISLISPPMRSLETGVESLHIASLALENFSQGAKLMSENLSNVVSTQTNTATFNIEASTVAFSKAHFQSQQAQALAERSENAPFIGSKIKEASSSFELLGSLSQTAQELVALMPDITGTNSKKTYLVLLMNNTELRPGGGFIGNIGEINFENNKLKEIKIEDVYTIDGQLKEQIAPPPQMTEKLGVKQLFLRDSNWSTDFRINAQTVQDFYKKETGKTVDGVIALDLTLVEKLLEKIGPLKLTDYEEEINHTNLFDKGEYYSEVGFFPGSTQKRDFFASLTRTLLGKIMESLGSHNAQVGNAPWMAVFQTMNEGLAQKHLLFSFDNENLNALTRSKNWDNVVPPSYFDPKDDTGGTRDFLALSEANIGANKVNRYIKREVSYDMTIGRDADLMATLTLTYKNESPADTWPGGTYVNYLRILTPLNSSIESYMEDGKKVDLEETIKGIKSPTIETTQAGELTQFAKLIEVPVKQTKTFTFKYRIPKNIKLETTPLYDLYISKQPGTNADPLKFTFNLPAYLKIDSINDNEDQKGAQNHTIQSDLTVDRHFQVKVSKK